MANTKISDLPVIGTLATADLIAVVDDDESDVSIKTKQATVQDVLDLVAGSGGVLPSVFQGRLTTETGVPVSTSDRTAQSTIYLTPSGGNIVALYNGSAWAYHTLTERSLALSGLTSGKNYDVFLYDNAGTLTLELSAAWTNDTTRADALALQDGIYVKSGTTTRRYVGTIRTTGTTTTEDSMAKRFVWSAYNRVPRFLRVVEATASWPYTSATWQQANAAPANQLDFVTGLPGVMVDADVTGMFSQTTASVVGMVGIGLDSTSVNSATRYSSAQVVINSTIANVRAFYRGYPGIGRHTLVWLERVHSASGTTTWYGTPTFTVEGGKNGIAGVLEG